MNDDLKFIVTMLLLTLPYASVLIFVLIKRANGIEEYRRELEEWRKEQERRSK